MIDGRAVLIILRIYTRENEDGLALEPGRFPAKPFKGHSGSEACAERSFCPAQRRTAVNA